MNAKAKSRTKQHPSWTEKQAHDVPPIKVQRRMLELINDARRSADLMLRFGLKEKAAAQIIDLKNHTSPFGFHEFRQFWDPIDIQIRTELLEWFRRRLRGESEDPIDIPEALAHHEAPVHAALLKNGKVLLIPHAHEFEGLGVTYVWDPQLGGAAAFNETDNQPSENLYCSGHVFMSDGRLFLAGGGGAHPDDALNTCWIYDPEAGTYGEWSQVPETMAYKRWYPTVVALGGGDILIVAGRPNDDKIEVFHESPSASDRFETVSTSPSVDFTQSYPGMHLLPNGQIFNSPTGFADNATNTFTGTMPEDGRLFTVSSAGGTWSGTWQTLPSLGAMPMNSPKRAKGMSAPVFTRHADGSYGSKVVVACGGGKDSSETVTFATITPTWSEATIPGGPRNNANVVLLPDGKVFLLGGATSSGVAVDECALYDPSTGIWTEMDSLMYRRAYHSVVVLLPSGQVMVTGDEDSYSIEIYNPPYLYAPGPKPRITSAPDIVHHSWTFEVTWADSDTIDRVVLVRPMAVTHQTDTEQRVIELQKTTSGDTLTLTAPNGNHPHPLAPRGHYLLFLINDAGVPSIGRFLFLH